MQRSLFVGLGANLPSRVGPPLATLAAALDAIDRLPLTRVAAVSGAYRTDPVGPPQPRYVNAAAQVRTALGPLQVLSALLAIEWEFGRRRALEERWGPRTLDLDLLVDGESCVEGPGLAVPHPRLGERAFVLVPLAEIAPELPVPPSGSTVRSLLHALRRAAGGRDCADVVRLGDLRWPRASSI